MSQQTCRSCEAPIIWTITGSGARTPVDAEPLEGGTIVLEQRQLGIGAAPASRVTTREERKELERQSRGRGETLLLFMSHFATCPQSDEWRK